MLDTVSEKILCMSISQPFNHTIWGLFLRLIAHKQSSCFGL